MQNDPGDKLPSFLKAAALDENPATRRMRTQYAYKLLYARWLIELALIFDWPVRLRPAHYSDDRWAGQFLEAVNPFTGEPGIRIAKPKEKSRLTQIVGRLRARRAELLAAPLQPDLPLFRNIAGLAGLLELSEADQAILCFVTLLQSSAGLHNSIAGSSALCTTEQMFVILSQLLGFPVPALRKALAAEAPLRLTGIVNLRPGTCDLENKIGAPDGLADLLMAENRCDQDLIAHFVSLAPPPRLSLSDFPHLKEDTEVALAVLRGAMRQRTSGVNLLVYGPPGQGKTEYAGALAHALTAVLYEVHSSDDGGDPIRGSTRLRAYNLCQRMLSRRPGAMLLFDEIEDIWEHHGESSPGKAWLNRALERNPVPAIWVSNSLSGIDPAYLRRFDHSIRFRPPPKAVRRTIARGHLGGLPGIDHDWIEAIISHEQLTAAQFERAARIGALASQDQPQQIRRLVARALERSSELLGQGTFRRGSGAESLFDQRFLNTDPDVTRLLAALRQRKRGRLCFYGPPGTGKSELARHLAREMELPTVLKRASDLLSCWLGESEKQIAAMFEEARSEGAVLILDEADSFLRDRRGAQRSWEVTQVNELLTQMESFEGVFVCTTNLFEHLDAASLRRFAWKVRFDWLTMQQRWTFYLEELARYGAKLTDAAELKEPMRKLNQLTPGDFASVREHFEAMNHVPDAAELFRELESEVRMKSPQGSDKVIRPSFAEEVYQTQRVRVACE